MTVQHELLIELLDEVKRGLGEHMRQVHKDRDLPFSHMIVMGQIRKHPGITVSELARRTGMAKSNVSAIVEELSQRGLAERQSDPGDQRLIRLNLTQAAVEQWQQTRLAMRQRLGDVVAEISDAKIEALIDGLQTIRLALERAKEKEHGGDQ